MSDEPAPPSIIYLQWTETDPHEGVTWCKDKLHETDVEYGKWNGRFAQLIDTLRTIEKGIDPERSELEMWIQNCITKQFLILPSDTTGECDEYDIHCNRKNDS